MAKSKIQSTRTSRVSKHTESSSDENDWLATYGDLMSLLLIFFVLFYIFSVTGQMPLLSDALEAYQSDVKRSSELPQLEDTMTPESSRGEVILTIPSQVLFDQGKADLRPEAIPFLKQAVDSIRTLLRETPDLQIRVEGYTDNVPIHNWRFRNNWELSAIRAISVVNYLIEIEQFPPMQLQSMGYGEYNPVAPNDTPENRRRNRRVEMKVVQPPTTITAESQPQKSPQEIQEEERERVLQEAANKLLGNEGEE
jgi:chemotaxis protein MotB